MTSYAVKILDRLKWDELLFDGVKSAIKVATSDGELCPHRPAITGDEKVAFIGDNPFSLFGFILFFEARPRVLWVDILFVDTPYREQKVGSTLMQAAVDYAERHGYLRVEYGTTRENSASRRLGEKLGFGEPHIGLALNLPDTINPPKPLPRMPAEGESDIPF